MGSFGDWPFAAFYPSLCIIMHFMLPHTTVLSYAVCAFARIRARLSAARSYARINTIIVTSRLALWSLSIFRCQMLKRICQPKTHRQTQTTFISTANTYFKSTSSLSPNILKACSFWLDLLTGRWLIVFLSKCPVCIFHFITDQKSLTD